jgi:hypothetical protein
MSDAFERAAQREEAEHWRRGKERRARGNRTGFRIHLMVYIGVQVLLVAVWALQWQLGGTWHPWFVYALLGWGVGLAAHYAAVRDSLRSPIEPG